MTPCSEIARIVHETEDLSWFEKTKLKFHLSMCRHCSNYAKHIEMVSDGFRAWFKRHASDVERDVMRLEEQVLKRI